MKTLFILNGQEITQANILAITDADTNVLISLKDSNGILRLFDTTETKYIIRDVDLFIQDENDGYTNNFKTVDLETENYVVCFVEIAAVDFAPPMNGELYNSTGDIVNIADKIKNISDNMPDMIALETSTDNIETTVGITCTSVGNIEISAGNIETSIDNIETSLSIITNHIKSAVAPTATLLDATTNASTIVATNTNRISLTLQNIGVQPVLIALGSVASATNFNFILSGDPIAKSGQGGILEIKDSTCSISAITEASTSKLCVCEISMFVS